MAKIIGLQEKQAALTEIQLSLKSLKPLNAFVENENPSNEYVITFSAHKAKLKCEDKEKLNELVLNYKKTIVEHILEQAKKYEIELDDDEYALMGLSRT